MLDLSSAKPVYRWEMAPDHSTATPPPTRVVRLIRAYLAGYRPDDWPERVKKEEARIAALREHQASLGI